MSKGEKDNEITVKIMDFGFAKIFGDDRGFIRGNDKNIAP